MWQTVWFVRGRGPFPVDLLRRAAAFPQTHMDSEMIERTLTGQAEGGHVTLVSRQSKTEVLETLDVVLWEGTGWSVVDITEPKEVE